MMIFEVKDMSCGHCVGAIRRALEALDSGAVVDIDLAAHRVAVTSSQVSAAAIADAIREAGYTPVPA